MLDCDRRWLDIAAFRIHVSAFLETIPDGHAIDDVAFPVLSAKDIAALTARGHARAVRAGEVLFAEGDRDFCFFVVLEGAIEIVEHSRGTPAHGRGAPARRVHRRRGHALGPERAGDRAGRRATVGWCSSSAGELRRAVDELPELGETIVKAFLMRRDAPARARASQGFRIIGSRFSPEAHRLRDFATRNAIPFRFMDLETDEQADAILRQFDIPAVGHARS